MKKLLFCSVLLCLAVFNSTAAGVSGSAYKVDDQQVETLFGQSCDVTGQLSLAPAFSAIPSKTVTEDKQMVGGIIAIAELITGIGWLIPIHRIYLGMGGSGTKIILGYVCTLSGCGVILLVDAISLLIDSNGSKYLDNPKFIMWN